MNCCHETKLDLVIGGADPDGLNRRTLIKGAAGIAGLSVASSVTGARAQPGDLVRLAFCSQLLCIVPYEVTRVGNFFANEGLNVELVYTRGGNAAMQALVGGAVDYAATSFDVAVQAFANGAGIRRFATTGRLPLFALAVAPDRVEEIREFKDLEGQTVGISGLGNADHTLMLFLLVQAGADPSTVQFAALGPNMFEALRQGQVAAGMVQEPALTLIAADGGRILFNAMNLSDAEQYLGGPYEFMGIAYRAEEREERLEQMQAMARALQAGLQHQRTAPVSQLREAVPAELMVGGEGERFDQIISDYRESIYPESVAIDVEACQRVVDALHTSGALTAEVDLTVLLDTEVVPG